MMSQPTQSNSRRFVIEGELVRDVWTYEYDDLEIGGVDIMQFVLRNLGPGREKADGDTRLKTYFGRVRLTLERLESPSLSTQSNSED